MILFHSYDKWGYSKMGPENDDRYVRYVMARLSAYRNVWWSMANEYDLMIHKKEKTLADFDRFFQIFQNEDPHQRLRGNHNWYSSEDHFYDHSQPWVTHVSMQSNEFYNLLKWRERYQKPLLVDEMRYEGDVTSNWGNMSGEEMTSYFWMAGLCGGYPLTAIRSIIAPVTARLAGGGKEARSPGRAWHGSPSFEKSWKRLPSPR